MQTCKCYIETTAVNIPVILRIEDSGKVVARVSGRNTKGLPHLQAEKARWIVDGFLVFQGSRGTFKLDGNKLSATCEGSSGTLTMSWKLNKTGTELTPLFRFRWTREKVVTAADLGFGEA